MSLSLVAMSSDHLSTDIHIDCAINTAYGAKQTENITLNFHHSRLLFPIPPSQPTSPLPPLPAANKRCDNFTLSNEVHILAHLSISLMFHVYIAGKTHLPR